jgi:hypothetical protein
LWRSAQPIVGDACAMLVLVIERNRISKVAGNPARDEIDAGSLAAAQARVSLSCMNTEATQFLDRPGVSGAFGALMDEYARAAVDLCRVVERFEQPRFEAEHSSPDPDCRSARAVCLHVYGAARRYSDYIRKARGLAFDEKFVADASRIARPGDLRGCLVEAIRYTEGALEGLYDAPEKVAAAITFQVRWGPTYDPEMILEHAVMHLLRHRRQLERWPR